jgi:putative transposase
MSKISSTSVSFMPATLTPQRQTFAPAAELSTTSTTNYFITLCTHERQCLFGEIIEGQMQLNELGAIVENEWQNAAQVRLGINCDQWIIMPNHIHGIVTLAEPLLAVDDPSNQDPAVSPDRLSASEATQQQTLSAWIDEFKEAVTQRISTHRQTPRPIWQLTDDQQRIPHHFAFHIFRQYIRSNTHAWLWDKLHPDSPSDWLHPEGSA